MQSEFSSLRITLVLAALSFVACTETESGLGGGTNETSSTTSTSVTSGLSSTGADPFPGCQRGVLEADFGATPFSGPGVDPDTGAIAPGNYVVAATYLALQPSQVARAMSLGGQVIGSLSSAKGLVAYSTGGSTSCAALRTISVWESEEDMVAFVISVPHATAMQATSEISRGTSNTTSWEGDATTVTWNEGAQRLAAKQGGDL